MLGDLQVSGTDVCNQITTKRRSGPTVVSVYTQWRIKGGSEQATAQAPRFPPQYWGPAITIEKKINKFLNNLPAYTGVDKCITLHYFLEVLDMNIYTVKTIKPHSLSNPPFRKSNSGL